MLQACVLSLCMYAFHPLLKVGQALPVLQEENSREFADLRRCDQCFWTAISLSPIEAWKNRGGCNRRSTPKIKADASAWLSDFTSTDWKKIKRPRPGLVLALRVRRGLKGTYTDIYAWHKTTTETPVLPSLLLPCLKQKYGIQGIGSSC